MALFPTHNHHSYYATNDSVAKAAGVQMGTLVTSGAANTFGTWTEIHAGLTYGCDLVTVNINAVETSADVIAATVLNVYIDIGIGPDSSSVVTVLEKLGGSQAQGLGVTYFIPVRFPPDTKIWARHQNTAASAKAGVSVSFQGGQMNPGAFPSFSGLKAIGAVSASTEGTAITPANGSEGGWAQIIASTTEDYGGLMCSPLFNVDTALNSGISAAFDIGMGASGQEVALGENVTRQFVWSNNEQKDAICLPVFTGIPTGSRLCARASQSGAAETQNSVILYGFVH